MPEHAFGWIPDRPDHRDRSYNCEEPILKAHQLPAKIDPLTLELPIYDQGQLGSCTGNGNARVLAHAAWREGEGVDMFSRLFIYYNERVLEGTVDSDSGAAIRDGIKVIAQQGAPLESVWPYDITQFAVKPSLAAYEAALKHEAIQYRRVDLGPGAPFRSALAAGLPIVFGFPVPVSFEDGSWDPATQVLPVPGPADGFIGGHCTVISGYDYTRSEFHEPFFWIDNSWGSGFGAGGRFRMAANWLGHLTSDHWVVERVK